MLKNKKLYDELTAYRQVFPNVVLMVQSAMTTPVKDRFRK
jgi:hypothetical protein